MLDTHSTPDPLALLREFLADDRAAGLEWEPEQFAHTVYVACRETGSPNWRWPIIETYYAWADAYRGVGARELESLDFDTMLIEAARY